jgi:hypothetical protein
VGPGSRTGEGLGLPLLYWHFWRERLARPEQSRLQRKEKWALSDLLFPNSQGRGQGAAKAGVARRTLAHASSGIAAPLI